MGAGPCKLAPVAGEGACKMAVGEESEENKERELSTQASQSLFTREIYETRQLSSSFLRTTCEGFNQWDSFFFLSQPGASYS